MSAGSTQERATASRFAAVPALEQKPHDSELDSLSDLTDLSDDDEGKSEPAGAGSVASRSTQTEAVSLEQDSQPAAGPSDRRRSQRLSLSTRAQAKAEEEERKPSAKALGKRRAVSPVVFIDDEGVDAPPPIKKRRLNSRPTNPSYNLRKRKPALAKVQTVRNMPRKSRPSTASSSKGASAMDFDDDVVALPSSSRAAKKRSRMISESANAKTRENLPKEQDDIRMEVEEPIENTEMDDLADNMVIGEFGDAPDSDHDDSDHEDNEGDDNEDHDDDDEGENDEGMPFVADDIDPALVGDADDQGDGGLGDPALLAAAYQAFGGGFGAGYSQLMSGISKRFKNLLVSLKDTSGDPTIKLVALQELSEILSMSTEDTLSGCFSVDAYVRTLVDILRGNDVALVGEESGVEMMLLACRCLANLMEALPDTGHSMVVNGAVPVLCSKLLEIQYIDLAEQTLSTLEKLSEEMPNAIVREGGLTALLSFLDFFSTNVQRTAVTAAANCCRSLSADSFQMVKEVAPILQQTLAYADQRVVEQSCLAITRIIESYRHSAEKLETLLTRELLGAVVGLLFPGSGQSPISVNTYSSILRVLGLAAKTSSGVAMLMLDSGIADSLYQLLTGMSPPHSDEIASIKAQHAIDDMFVLQNLVHRPKDQVSEALTLVAELLPALPRDGLFNAKPNASRTKKSKTKVKAEESSNSGILESPNEPDLPVKQEERGNSEIAARPAANTPLTREQLNDKRIEALEDAAGSRQTAVKRFYALLLPTLTDVYTASIGLSIRTKTIAAMLKIVHFTGKEQLEEIVTALPIANFLGSVLSAKGQPSLLVSGLQLVELLITKLPDTAPALLRAEGVLFEVEQLADVTLNTAQPTKGASNAASATNLTDIETGPDLGTVSATGGPSAISRAFLSGLGGPSPSGSSTASGDAQLQDLVTLRAKFMRDRYIASGASAVQANKEMKHIKGLVEKLAKLAEASAPMKKTGQNSADKVLSDIANLFTRTPNPISSFELLESGLVNAMLKFMVSIRGSDADAVAKQRTLANVFCQPATTTPFNTLVKRLQESLGRLEEFDVVTALQSSSDDRRNSASMLTRQLKLRLISDDPDIPRTCSNVIVSIHAIATFQAFNDYLRPRIAAASGTPSGLPGRLSGALAALSAASSNAAKETAADRLSSSFGAMPALGASPPAALLSEDAAPLRRSSRLTARASQADLNAGASVDEAIDGQVEGDGLEEALTSLEPTDDGSKLEGHTPGGTRVATPSASKPGTPSTRSSSNLRKTSYAAALKSTPTDWHLEFTMGSNKLQLDTTIYGAVHQHESTQASAQRSFWTNIYTVKFRKVDGPAVPVQRHSAEPNDADADVLDASNSRQDKVLQLLRSLHTFNSNLPSLLPSEATSSAPESAFINNKLTAKMNRQLEEPMIVASSCLPEWALDLPHSFPFLFPFESRFSFLQSTSFGYARLMQKWVGQARQESRRDDNLGFLGRLQRQKVRIARDRLLESAFKVFELYGQSRAMLEIEFFNEVGTGLGPTLEFYALVSKEFSRKDLKLWREGDDDGNPSAFVYNKNGLFPAPLPADASNESAKKITSIFRMLGQFVARALMDSRIVDLAFSRAFMQLVLDQDLPLTIASVKLVDATLGKSLDSLQAYVDAKEEIMTGDGLEEEKNEAIENIKIRDAKIEDLALDFTLPGNSDIELKDDGAEDSVTMDNVEEYIALVIEYTLTKGTRRQVQAFREGFSVVFPVKDLACFTAEELVLVFGNSEEDWTVDTLQDSLRADHGFSMDSRVVRELLQAMSLFDAPQRRLFLSFATGSPRLPVGGFRALHPALTVVRKLPEPGHIADEYLPSVMTCQNYIKMPEYSDSAILQSRLHTAVSEGQGAFLLS